MSDGHTGVGNAEMNRGGSKPFDLVMSMLVQADGRAEFVLHAKSNSLYPSRPTPEEFLVEIGFEAYRGECPFHWDRCFWRTFASVPRRRDGMDNFNDVQLLHDAFRSFASTIGGIFDKWREIRRELGRLAANARPLQVFASPPEIDIPDSETPLWVKEVEFLRLRDLARQTAEVQEEINDLRGYLPLLYASGGELEAAVLKSLRFLGLKAYPTEPGATVDIVAETQDGKRRFGFEVTGTNGSIGKDSKKLTQVVDFERIKQRNEKTVLLAVTHNRTPISDREELLDFTQPAVEFLKPFRICLLTGPDLYRAIGGVMEKKRRAEDVVDLIYGTDGVLTLPDEQGSAEQAS